MGDTVLVTGGAGFVGSHVTRKLLERGRHVRVLDSFLYGREGLRDVMGHANLELLEGDIRDREALAGAMRGAKSVIALAALVGDAACDIEPEVTMAVNYDATRDLVEECRGAGVRRLVFASSCSVYGANGSDSLREDSHINPVSLYAKTRVMSEDLLHEAAKDLEVVTLRLATVCGVSARMRFDLMVNTMTACAEVKRAVRVTGASQWRPHIHVQDAAEAFILASEADVESGSVFNVGSDGQNFTIGDVAQKVADHVPGIEVENGGENGDRRSYKVSFDRIRDGMGFKPTFTVDNAIDEVRELFESGQVEDYTDKRFHNFKFLSDAR